MRTPSHTEYVQYFSRKLVPLATGITLLISVLAPVTFWIIAQRNLQHMVTLYANDLAEKLQQVALESPALWKYQTYKFIAIVEGFHPTIDVSGFRVLDEKGVPIAGHDTYPVTWGKPGQSLSFLGDLKYTLGAAPIRFNGRQVGTVEVLADDSAIFRTSALIFCFSLLIGISLGVLVYRFPVMVVRKMTGKIEELIVNLRHSRENYRGLNAELELKIAERTRELIEKQGELLRREKLNLLGIVAGNVGNELRNPLGVMRNAVFFLESGLAGGDESGREYLGIIKEEIDSSQRILSNFIDYFQASSPRVKAVSVPELIKQSLAGCAVPESVTVRVELAETLPAVRIDPSQMRQVFQNLIANAVQAMPEGGALRIRASFASAGLAPARAGVPPQDFVNISVADSGAGIFPEHLELIFQPLFTTKSRGIGLGLSICQGFVEANGGRVEVESEVGKGAAFTVLLPAERGEG